MANEVCRHCGETLVMDSSIEQWVHAQSGVITCYVHPRYCHAEPKEATNA